jgi:hypothetical protein
MIDTENDQPIASTSATTIKSLDTFHTHLPSTAPPHYLSHHIASTLLRKGFAGAEAGALAEIERLLEHRKLIISRWTRADDQIYMPCSPVRRNTPISLEGLNLMRLMF